MPNDMTVENVENESLNLFKLIDAIKSGWHWLVGGAALGLAGAVGFLMVAPAQYEAAGVIQPATVGMATATAAAKGVEVESVLQTLERLKMPMFYMDNLLEACDVRVLENPRKALAKAVKPMLVKGNSLIEISYRGKSPAVAEACVGAVVEQLAKAQAKLAEPMISTLQEQLKLTKQQLDEAERFQEQIEKRAMSMDPSDAKFSQSMLMLNAALSKREEISKLRKLYVEQSLLLSEPLTKPAKLFEPIYSSGQAIFPQKTVTALGGFIGGLLLSGLALFVRRIWLRRKPA